MQKNQLENYLELEIEFSGHTSEDVTRKTGDFLCMQPPRAAHLLFNKKILETQTESSAVRCVSFFYPI